MLRLIENLRFTKAPTCAMALDMMSDRLLLLLLLLLLSRKHNRQRFANDSGVFKKPTKYAKYFAGPDESFSRGHDLPSLWRGTVAEVKLSFL